MIKSSIYKLISLFNAWLASTVADTEGIHVVRLNPFLRQNYSIFMRNFKQNQHKLSNNHVQFSNGNLLCKFEPSSKKSWIAPASTIYFILFTWASPYGTHMEPGCTAHMGPIWVPYRLLAAVDAGPEPT